ncbi:MAG: hypothetical protein H0T62_00910 [Parachlamydiaceae bacterium]|nr:hypothetical protein [Parachlamydiaceae bacterium]
MEISSQAQYGLPLFVDWLPSVNNKNSEQKKSLAERIYDCFLETVATSLIVLELAGMTLATLTFLPLFSEAFTDEWRRIFNYFFNNDEKSVIVTNTHFEEADKDDDLTDIHEEDDLSSIPQQILVARPSQEPSNLQFDEANQFVILPKELLHEIFMQLSRTQVSSVGQVRKLFFEVTCNPHFIMSYHIENNIRFTTEKILNLVESKGHTLEILDLSGLIRYTSQITSLQFSTIVSRCPNIHTLNLGRVDWITSDHVKEIKSLTKLTNLDFWEFLDLKDEDLIDLPFSLQQLNLRDCKGLSGKAIENFRPLHQLRILNLTGCISATTHGLTQLEDFQELEEIYLISTNINDEAMKSLSQLKKLKVIFLTNCAAVTDVGINILLEELPSLNLLALKGCTVSDDLKQSIKNETKIRL